MRPTASAAAISTSSAVGVSSSIFVAGSSLSACLCKLDEQTGVVVLLVSVDDRADEPMWNLPVAHEIAAVKLADGILSVGDAVELDEAVAVQQLDIDRLGSKRAKVVFLRAGEGINQPDLPGPGNRPGRPQSR